MDAARVPAQMCAGLWQEHGCGSGIADRGRVPAPCACRFGRKTMHEGMSTTANTGNFPQNTYCMTKPVTSPKNFERYLESPAAGNNRRSLILNGCPLSARFSLGEAMQKSKNPCVGGVFLDILLHNSCRLVSFCVARSSVDTMTKCSWNARVWMHEKHEEAWRCLPHLLSRPKALVFLLS